MTGVVDVIVDRDDDLATAHAIHNLAAREPTVLAVSIAPDWRDSPAAIWAILRALGKRTEHLDAATLNWQDTQRWLTAHQITELVILRAQHLKERTIQELKWHLVTLAGIAVTLLYSGARAIPSHPTTTITDLLARPRPAPSTSRLAKWPIVPRSHPLRLRSDCSQHLAPDPFRKVDQLLCGACRTLSRWLQDRRPVSTAQLATAISIVSHGVDPDHAYIRQSATKIALALARIQPPPPRPLTIQPAAISDHQLAAILAHTDPGTAGFLLAEQLTQLPASHIELIGPDQITAERITSPRARPPRPTSSHRGRLQPRLAARAPNPASPTTARTRRRQRLRAQRIHDHPRLAPRDPPQRRARRRDHTRNACPARRALLTRHPRTDPRRLPRQLHRPLQLLPGSAPSPTGH